MKSKINKIKIFLAIALPLIIFSCFSVPLVRAVVTVNVTLSANPIITGSSSLVRWSSAGGATFCTSPNFSTGNATNNAVGVSVSPVSTTTYTVNCYRPEGTITATACTIPVGSSSCNVSLTWTTLDLSTNPTEVTRNNPANTHISWLTSGTNVSNTISSGPGSFTYFLYHNSVLLSQSSVVNVACASGSAWNGSTCAGIPPPVPVVTISSNPITGTVGVVNPTITWSATNTPTSCTASGDWSGSKAVGGGSQAQGVLNSVRNYNYTLTCSNAGGASVPQTATVIVTAVPPSATATLTPNPNPAVIVLGQPVTLTWTSTGAVSCTGTGFATANATANAIGVVVTPPVLPTTYTLVCYNSIGVPSLPSTVVVTATPQKKPIYQEP